MSRRAEIFLEEQKVLRLATVDGSGEPHVVPVWYLYRNSAVYIGTNTRTIKARNVREAGRAAFCVDQGIRSPLYGVMGRGRATLVTDSGFVREMARTIMLRYFDTLDDPSARELLDDTDCIIRVEPAVLTDWS